MIPLLLASLISSPLVIEIVDSRDDVEVTYIIINQTCKVKILKSELRDYDKVVDKAIHVCKLD